MTAIVFWIAMLLAVLFVAFAFISGAVKGYRQERHVIGKAPMSELVDIYFSLGIGDRMWFDDTMRMAGMHDEFLAARAADHRSRPELGDYGYKTGQLHADLITSKSFTPSSLSFSRDLNLFQVVDKDHNVKAISPNGVDWATLLEPAPDISWATMEDR